jgi:hypothetical protein
MLPTSRVGLELFNSAAVGALCARMDFPLRLAQTPGQLNPRMSLERYIREVDLYGGVFRSQRVGGRPMACPAEHTGGVTLCC